MLYVASATLLEALGVDEDLCHIVRHTGERWDGQGPLGLADCEIPLLSRILSIAATLAERCSNLPTRINGIQAGDSLLIRQGLEIIQKTNRGALCPYVLSHLLSAM